LGGNCWQQQQIKSNIIRVSLTMEEELVEVQARKLNLLFPLPGFLWIVNQFQFFLSESSQDWLQRLCKERPSQVFATQRRRLDVFVCVYDSNLRT
jgi:hypothetical protein